ncbi:hypothetical protein Tco_0925761 [Tanacetum coccineum]|uniref:Uncharacterized protein n=1 Tax=Tanacetum coccineum TaxID=301880 RepID=A0ABQ5DAE2_9ASTR
MRSLEWHPHALIADDNLTGNLSLRKDTLLGAKRYGDFATGVAPGTKSIWEPLLVAVVVAPNKSSGNTSVKSRTTGISLILVIMRPIRRIQDFDESKYHCLTLKNTPYPHEQYAVYNTLVNEEESTSFTSIRRIHQGRYGVSVPALTKDHRRIKTNTPYPEAFIRRIQ